MENHIKMTAPDYALSAASILLVDDDADDLLFLTSSILSQAPFLKLMQVCSVAEAMNYLNRLPTEDLPSLIILDYNMPRQNGVDFLKVLNEQQRYLPIKKVVLSTAESSLIHAVCMKNGSHACFTKPDSIGLYKILTERLLNEYLVN